MELNGARHADGRLRTLPTRPDKKKKQSHQRRKAKTVAPSLLNCCTNVHLIHKFVQHPFETLKTVNKRGASWTHVPPHPSQDTCKRPTTSLYTDTVSFFPFTYPVPTYSSLGTSCIDARTCYSFYSSFQTSRPASPSSTGSIYCEREVVSATL